MFVVVDAAVVAVAVAVAVIVVVVVAFVCVAEANICGQRPACGEIAAMLSFMSYFTTRPMRIQMYYATARVLIHRLSHLVVTRSFWTIKRCEETSLGAPCRLCDLKPRAHELVAWQFALASHAQRKLFR